MWRNLFYNPKTTFGAVMALASIVLYFMGKTEAAAGLLATATIWIGVASKDSDKQ